MKLFKLFFLTLILFSFINFVLAEDISDQINSNFEELQDKVDKIENLADNPSEIKNNLTNQYLKKQWEAFLINKPVIGQLILGYKTVSPYTDPVVNFFVGMIPEFSWFFILVLFVWYTLVKYYSQIYDIFINFSTFSNSTSLVIAIGFFLILTVLQFFQVLTRMLAELIVKLIGFLVNPLFQVIAVFIVFVLIGLVGKYNKSFSKFLLARKKMREENERIARSEYATKKVEIYGEALDEGLGKKR